MTNQISPPIYVSHLADDNDPTETACGEPWQGWQEPDDCRRRTGFVLTPFEQPRPHVDPIRFCGACARLAQVASQHEGSAD